MTPLKPGEKFPNAGAQHPAAKVAQQNPATMALAAGHKPVHSMEEATYVKPAMFDAAHEEAAPIKATTAVAAKQATPSESDYSAAALAEIRAVKGDLAMLRADFAAHTVSVAAKLDKILSK